MKLVRRLSFNYSWHFENTVLYPKTPRVSCFCTSADQSIITGESYWRDMVTGISVLCWPWDTVTLESMVENSQTSFLTAFGPMECFAVKSALMLVCFHGGYRYWEFSVTGEWYLRFSPLFTVKEWRGGETMLLKQKGGGGGRHTNTSINSNQREDGLALGVPAWETWIQFSCSWVTLGKALCPSVLQFPIHKMGIIISLTQSYCGEKHTEDYEALNTMVMGAVWAAQKKHFSSHVSNAVLYRGWFLARNKKMFKNYLLFIPIK